MRFYSFLADIEQAVMADSPAHEGVKWETNRTVNLEHRLARLTLKALPGVEAAAPGGVIFVQAFEQPGGSCYLQVNLNWRGSDAFPTYILNVRPNLDWALEAARIASTWLAGAPELDVFAPQDLRPIVLTPIYAVAAA